MVRIRKINVHDRLKINELLQQNDSIAPHELDSILNQIDRYLFDNDHNIISIIVSHDVQKNITGYSCYGLVAGTTDYYKIIELIVFGSDPVNRIKQELLEYIESEIKKRNGKFISIRLPEGGRQAELLQFIGENRFRVNSEIMNYYGPEINQQVFTKTIQPVKGE